MIRKTQAFLELLIEGVSSAPTLLLFNYRPEYTDRWVGRANYTHIRIDPLPPVNGEEMLEDLLGAGAELTPLRRLLMERTEGYPFFIEETVQSLVEDGTLEGERGTYRITVPPDHIQVPATIQAVISARIDRLPPAAQTASTDRSRHRQGLRISPPQAGVRLGTTARRRAIWQRF